MDIYDTDQLYRRVLAYHITDHRVSSAAFKDRRKQPENRFSVDCARLTTPQACLRRGVAGLKLIALLAATPRSLGFRVWHDPEEGNVAHCSVAGENSPEKCAALATASRVVDTR